MLKPDEAVAFTFFMFISDFLTISFVILIGKPWNSYSLDEVLLSQENSTLRSFWQEFFQVANFDLSLRARFPSTSLTHLSPT